MHVKSHILLIIAAIVSVHSIAQQDTISGDYDRKYREDQFYVGVTYNIITDVPGGVATRGLSGGINFGYLRDMPINDQRNIAIALGAGLSFDQYGQTLFIGELPDETTVFDVIDDDTDLDVNRFSTATVEVPIEFRWRSSTAESYKFWRVYAGLRLGYTYYYRSVYKQAGVEVNQTDIPEFEPFRTNITLSFGYNTFNLYALYSINPFFTDATTVDGQVLDFRTIKVGLIFYIL